MTNKPFVSLGTVHHLATEAGWVAPVNEHSTDVGNGERLIRYFGQDIRYVPELGKWIVFENVRWRWDDDELIYQYAKKATDCMIQDARQINDEDMRKKLINHALSSENISRLKAMIEMASKEKSAILHQRNIDSNPDLLGVANGVLDLKTGKIRPGAREDYITKHNNITFPEGVSHE